MVKDQSNSIPHEETVYVVSGFMRTGTSMMMHALETGGMETVKRDSRDDMRRRFADEQYDPNEGGLYELEAADFSAPGFPSAYKGKLIKLLNAGKVPLAVMPKIQIVFMLRDYEEIRQSYQAFFGMPLKVQDYAARMEENIAALRNRKDTELVVFQYRDVIENPLRHFEMLKDADWPIDAELAASIVRPELYRFRKEKLIPGIV